MPRRMTLLIFLIGLACIIQTGFSQEVVRQGQQCNTPENGIGQCSTLSNCTSIAIANALNIYPRNDAVQYLQKAERNCGNNNFRGDPVVCCGFNQEYVTTPRNPRLPTNSLRIGALPILVDPPKTTTTSTPKPSLSLIGEDCTGPNSIPGICKPLGRCETLVARLQTNPNNGTFIDFLKLSNKICNNEYSVVCCPSSTAVGLECAGPDSIPGNCKPLAECSSLIARLEANPNNSTLANFLKSSNKICDNEYSVVCCPSLPVGSECKGSDNVPGICTRQVECPLYFKHLPAKRGKILYCDNDFELVCCQKADIINIKKFPNNTNEIPRKLPSMADGCGYVQTDYNPPTIVGGTPSRVGGWPWIALIGYGDGKYPSPPPSRSSFKCGGALITSRHVLTAAHCIQSDLNFVRLGEHDLSTETETNYVDVPVVKYVRHAQYNKIDGHNDIALLYLGQNVQFSEQITPICIPFEPRIRSKNITDSSPFVAGWGRTMEGGKSSNVLQEIQLVVFDNDVCKDKYKKQGKFVSEEQFDSAVICAGDFELEGGQDTCQGDSGGPLMLPEFENITLNEVTRYHLIGIVSYGIGCARPDVPGVYTRVANFIEWIENGVADTSYLL